MRDLGIDLARLRESLLYRSRRVMDGPQGPRPVIDGRRMLSFCSNDYLGLANHPDVVAALKRGADTHGAGSGAAHLVTGHSAAHHALEEELAEFLGRQRALRSDPLRSLIDAGIPAGGGSDSYVTPMDPIYSIHCAANHSIPAERLDPERAIQLYTLDNARMAFEEKEKGSIEINKRADFTVVDNDPTRVSREAIKNIGIVMTVIGGRVVHSKL